MSSHRYWGVAIFCMAIATALMGIVENVGFKVQYSHTVLDVCKGSDISFRLQYIHHTGGKTYKIIPACRYYHAVVILNVAALSSWHFDISKKCVIACCSNSCT